MLNLSNAKDLLKRTPIVEKFDFKPKEIKFLRAINRKYIGTPCLWGGLKLRIDRHKDIRKTLLVFDENFNLKPALTVSKKTNMNLYALREGDFILKFFLGENYLNISLILIQKIDKYSNFAEASVLIRYVLDFDSMSFTAIQNSNMKGLPEINLSKLQKIINTYANDLMDMK